MRNYKKEYKDYHGSATQRARRSSRNKARRLAVKTHGKAAVKGKDVDQLLVPRLEAPKPARADPYSV